MINLKNYDNEFFNLPENFIEIPDQCLKGFIITVKIACCKIFSENISACLHNNWLDGNAPFICNIASYFGRELMIIFHCNVVEAVEAHGEFSWECVC